MALVGRFVPAGIIVLPVIVLPLFPVTVPVEKKIVPTAAPVPEPDSVQFVIVLFTASPINCIVEADEDVLVLLIVSDAPPVFNPLMVTLDEPLKLMMGAARLPLIEYPNPVG